MNTDKATGTIFLPTVSALAVWVCEITGQMSDGMWENTAPLDHWQFWCRLDPKLDRGHTPRVETLSTPWRQKTGYNIAGLYEYVGDRMLAQGRMGRALQALSYGVADTIDAKTFERTCSAGETLVDMDMDVFAGVKLSGEYLPKPYKVEAIRSVSDTIAQAFFQTKYDMRDLRTDVKFIKAAMKTVKSC